MTFLDTIKYQQQLAEILRRKCSEPVLTDEEKTGLPYITANALLSQGRKEHVILIYYCGTIDLGSLHSSILRLVDWANYPVIRVTQKKITFTLDLKIVWDHIYQMCIDAFPKALSEALSMSKEMPYREDIKSYRFSMDSDLE